MKAKRKKKARVAVEKGLFERRKAEKQKARKEDHRALGSGEKSREDLRREHSLFYGMKVRIRWDEGREGRIKAALPTHALPFEGPRLHVR